jgi:uncharacterized membrane protein YecN with MAPEG domain
MATPIYATLIGLLLVFLSIHTIKGRRKCGAGLGDAGDIEMQRRIRAQGNLAEYAPIFLILLGYAEYGNLPIWAVHVIGVIFISGRMMHAYSLLKAEQYDGHKLTANPIWRIRGMICTFNCIGLLSAIVTVQYFI